MALRGYLGCLGSYAEKYFSAIASPSEIADGAASACATYANAYAMYSNQAQVNSIVALRNDLQPAELERRLHDLDRDRPVAAEKFVREHRAATIDYVLKLRSTADRDPARHASIVGWPRPLEASERLLLAKSLAKLASAIILDNPKTFVGLLQTD